MMDMQRLLNGLSCHSSHHRAPSEPMAHTASSNHENAVLTLGAIAGNSGESSCGELAQDPGAVCRADMNSQI